MVIAIIAILAAMLLPALARAKDAAKRGACLSNTRQVAIAFKLFLGDNSDHFPKAVTEREATDTARWGTIPDTPDDRHAVLHSRAIAALHRQHEFHFQHQRQCRSRRKRVPLPLVAALARCRLRANGSRPITVSI